MEVSKNLMLAKMEITEQDGKPVVHDIVFVKEDGSQRKMRAMNHINHRQGNHEKAKGSPFKFNLKEKGALLLYDVDLEKPRTVQVDTIISFNGMQVMQ